MNRTESGRKITHNFLRGTEEKHDKTSIITGVLTEIRNGYLLIDSLRAERSGDQMPVVASRPVLGSTPSPVQWLPGHFPEG